MLAPRMVAAALLAALLAGCSGSTPDAGAASSASSSSTGPLGNLTEPAERLEAPRRVTLYFTADGELTPEMPAEGAVAIGSPTTGLATGLRPQEFLSTPASQAFLVVDEDVEVVAFVRSALPQGSNGAFDFGTQLGSTKASGVWGFMTGQPQAPGGTFEYHLTLPFNGQRPLLVPAGESLRGLVVGQFGGETGEPQLLVGGTSASRVELTLRNFTFDPLSDAQALDDQAMSGQLTGGSTVPSCDLAPGTTSMTHEVIVDAAALSLEVTLKGGGSQDIDLQLLDGTTAVAYGFSPLGEESIFLAAETLAGLQGKTLIAKAIACAPGPNPYTVTVMQARGPLPAA